MNPRNLTREAIEQLNDIEPYCFETDREEQWFNIGLQYGLDVADSDPISPWISVEDDLPCNHEELIEDKHCTKSVLVVLAWDMTLQRGTLKYAVCVICLTLLIWAGTGVMAVIIMLFTGCLYQRCLIKV